MRWVISFLLFFTGAIVVGLEVFVALALMEGGRSLAEQVVGLSRFAGLAVACLALATWLSPVNHWRALGRALMAGAALGIFGAVPVYLMVPDPYGLTWKLGLINLVLIVAIGAVLDRRPGEFKLL